MARSSRRSVTTGPRRAGRSRPYLEVLEGRVLWSAAADPAGLLAPAGLTALVRSKTGRPALQPPETAYQVTLAWSAAPADPDATAVAIERADGPQGQFAVIDSIPAGSTAYTDPTVLLGGQYAYRLRSAGPGSVSDPSEAVPVAVAPLGSLVKDVRPGFESSTPHDLVPFRGAVYFSASHPEFPEELWKTDGTEAGTVLVQDVWPGIHGSRAHALTPVGDTLFFIADDGTHGEELFTTDGSPGGAALVKDVRPADESTRIQTLTDARDGRRVYFVHGLLYQEQQELWVSDGSADGTHAVAGATIVIDNEHHPHDYWSTRFLAAASDGSGTLYFRGHSPGAGVELWKTDGTAAGTVPLADLVPGPDSSRPTNLTVAADGTLYFTATGADARPGVYRSDGTPEGTTLLRTLDSIPTRLAAAGGTLFFLTSVPTPSIVNITELWKSDGTPAGTVRVRAFARGAADPGEELLTAAGDGVVYAVVNDRPADTQSSLYRSDGTAAGTVRAADVLGKFPRFLTMAGGRAYFSSGTDVLRTDGTPAGTEFVQQYLPTYHPQWNSLRYPPTWRDYAVVGGALYLSAGQETIDAHDPGDFSLGRELWQIADTAPAAPAALSATTSSSSSSSAVQLAWADRSTNESGFYVDRSADAQFGSLDKTAWVPAGSTRYLDAAGAGATRYYRVRAFNAAGQSAPSNAARPTPGAAAAAGVVFNDADADGAKDAGESGPSGWRVYLDVDRDGRYDAGERSTLTGTGGAYRLSLTALPANTYRLRVSPPSGWRRTAPAAGYYDLAVPMAGDANPAPLAFGFTRTAVIRGTVYHDANANGSRAAADGEAGLSGWTVYLDANNNGRLDSTERRALTDAVGGYAFDALPPGVTYRVRQVARAGWRRTQPSAGVYAMTPAGGAAAAGKDFGNTTRVLVGGSVFLDANRNARRDAGEGALSGWRVYLDANGDGQWQSVERSTLSNSAGGWSFGDLAAGTYTVRIVRQSGYAGTTPASGAYRLVLPAGASATGKLFGQARVV